MMSDAWIVIPGWAKFQHYPDTRGIVWVKDYLDQLDRDEYLELTFAERGLLIDLRKLYARRRGFVRSDTKTLSRALTKRVTQRQLDSLNHAGFIQIVASKPLALRALAREELLRSSSRTRSRDAANAGDASSERSEKDNSAAVREADVLVAGWTGKDSDELADALDRIERKHHVKISALERDNLWNVAFGD